MLAHSTFYSKLHSILTDKWGDDPEFPRTTTSQKDAGCILDKFMGSLEEQDLNTVEVSEYFSKSYHIMNLTCQGSEVTGIVVQQALDSYSYSDHTAENLRIPVFTLFYCVLMTSNLVQQLEQRYQNNLEAFATVVHETLHSTCFQRARKLFPAMFPPLYIQACHPLKAMTSHYLHAVSRNKCLAFIASNHTFKETLTHSVHGLLEEASCFLPSSESQRSHNSMSSENECSLVDTQICQLRTGVEAIRAAFTSMFFFRHNCMGAGLRFSVQKREDKMMVFWMTHIHIYDQMPGVTGTGKTKTKAPRADSVPWEIIDHTIPGAQMASCFSVLKILFTERSYRACAPAVHILLLMDTPATLHSHWTGQSYWRQEHQEGRRLNQLQRDRRRLPETLSKHRSIAVAQGNPGQAQTGDRFLDQRFVERPPGQ